MDLTAAIDRLRASCAHEFAHFMSRTISMGWDASKATPGSSPHHLAAALGNQPRGALIAGINPQPAEGDAKPVAQADQKIDVRDAPYPPCKRAAQLEASEIDHRLPLADLRQAAGVLVAEWRLFVAAQARFDRFGDITPLLLGRRRNAGHRL